MDKNDYEIFFFLEITKNDDISNCHSVSRQLVTKNDDTDGLEKIIKIYDENIGAHV